MRANPILGLRGSLSAMSLRLPPNGDRQAAGDLQNNCFPFGAHRHCLLGPRWQCFFAFGRSHKHVSFEGMNIQSVVGSGLSARTLRGGRPTDLDKRMCSAGKVLTRERYTRSAAGARALQSDGGPRMKFNRSDDRKFPATSPHNLRIVDSRRFASSALLDSR